MQATTREIDREVIHWKSEHIEDLFRQALDTLHAPAGRDALRLPINARNIRLVGALRWRVWAKRLSFHCVTDLHRNIFVFWVEKR